MSSELGQISFYLAKEGNNFDSVTKEDSIQSESNIFKIREFDVDDASMKFFCVQKTVSNSENPPWLDFINERIEDKIYFDTFNKRPSGLLLININQRILAATFGTSGVGFLDKSKFLSDFGIKTAMNMCGNKELRQTKSSIHAYTTQFIDRQLSKPSDAFSFGLIESEFLQYISAHLESDSNVTLQGKDNLTIKIIGDNKLSWKKLMAYSKTFISEYKNKKYRNLFPNYPNLQDVSLEKVNELDSILIDNLSAENYNRIHLAIPEFIANDQFSFSYTNYFKRQNKVYSHIDIKDLKSDNVLDFNELKIEDIKNKNVYPFSHDEDKILEYKKWNLYTCIVAEVLLGEEYFILSGGEWKKVDNEFYNAVTNFIDNILQISSIPDQYHDINIFDDKRKQNREDIFNNEYCKLNNNAILFDQSKLRIGQGPKDKEFCDIFECKDGELAQIIHVKKYSGSSSLNYLFSQARFYCEFFLSDDTFLSEIRTHISKSQHPKKTHFLNYIKENQADMNGKDYIVRLWILYDRNKEVPNKSDLPLMAKYELKITYEKLRNILKYSDVSLSMIPAGFVKFTRIKDSHNN